MKIDKIVKYIMPGLLTKFKLCSFVNRVISSNISYKR